LTEILLTKIAIASKAKDALENLYKLKVYSYRGSIFAKKSQRKRDFFYNHEKR
jgi:DNA phosphorothioation-dependent restriction protein DptG